MPQRQITAMARMELPATLDNLTPLIQFVSTCAAEKGFSKKKLQIELATEEALVNIFNYAYPDHKGDVEVICNSVNNETLAIDIVDSGIPFDPFSINNPDIAGDISSREIGGLGIFLIKRLMDEVHYRRENGKNILSLIVSKSEIGQKDNF